jgi:phosphoribosylformimino-5-aminoimidazole carboxamide ribotide isomerase
LRVIPAIDLRGGKVVRLTQGDFAQEKAYSDNPIALAKTFIDEGARRIHIVDLEGALSGKPVHQDLIRQMIQELQAEFQIGGGIRDPKTAQIYLDQGAHRVIIGTRAALDEGFLKEMLGAFQDRVIIGIDASSGHVATNGWTRITDIPATRLVEQTLKGGGKEIIYTDISKDGTMQGPNLDQIKLLLQSFDLKLIASGGISSLGDIENLIKMKSKKLIGVIVGKALYEQKIKLKDALALC